MSFRLLPAAQAELDEAIAWYTQQAPGFGGFFFGGVSSHHPAD
jgi:hypothetical protein